MLVDPISWTVSGPFFLAGLIFGYLLGSIPFGPVIMWATGSGDLRKIGSGNIGATNVLRTGKKGLAAATLIGDALKGTVAVLVANHFFGPNVAILAGLGAFLGHLFPIWLKFKGGKGVATYLGVLLGLAPLVFLAFAAIWLAIAFATRYSSLAALVAAVLTPAMLWAFGFVQERDLFVILTVLMVWKHTENIKRLIAGTESRIGQKS
jgi:acyl phosphate:glycerol-3-phosphate acyltransferase